MKGMEAIPTPVTWATFEGWEDEVPLEIRADSVWRVEAYRLALYLADLAWYDVTRLLCDPRTAWVADQLSRSTGRISSSICEGYSRDTGKARATFYEYALGSARESRDWYFRGRFVLDEETVRHRMDLTTQIVRLTLTMAVNERRSNRRASD